MEIEIDREELARIQEYQKANKIDHDVLSAEFIEFEADLTKADEEVAPISTTTEKTDSKGGKSRVKKLTSVLHYDVPWMIQSDRKNGYSKDATERLHQEIVDFANYVSPTEEERFARSEAINRLEKVVNELWEGKATVQIFGSYDSQLYLPSSDLDVVIVHPGILIDKFTKPPLKKLAKAILKASIPIPESVKVITKARVPIIKYVDAQTNFEVDVSFNVTSGVEAATFMRTEMRNQPAIRPLTLALKQFLGMRSLNEVFYGGLGSYSIMCLVISFLQMHPLVQTGLIRAHENLGVLLLEIFELYGRNFNSEVVGIAVAHGGTYFEKEDRGWLQDNKPAILSIEDPQNVENDISKGSFAYGAVRHSFEHAFGILKCAIYEFQQYQHQINDGYKKSNHVPSILGSIITLDHKLLRHRYYIQQTANL